MTSDRTEHQSSDELRKSRDLSLEPARPPASIPGYRLQQFLGSGAYGEVWSATNLKTARRVAIKFYTRRNRNDVQLLAREVEKLVVLSADRYVVQLLDVGWDAQPPYYVMEYIEHGSLEDRLKSQRALPVSEALDIFEDLANGMLHLHSKGILHCDLKPGNVLLDEDGKPRVADFGQARLSTDQTPALGTLFYMAPEQADVNAMPDAAWDVYGLGALLFCMLTGQPPYYSLELARQIEKSERVGDRLQRYRDALTSSERPTEHRHVPGVDRALADLIDRCIAAHPKQRFNSVEAVLLAFRQREIVRARRPLLLSGIIGPLLLMSVVILFGWWAFNQSMDRTSQAVLEKARESNEFAAKLAARSAAEQIDEYFRVVSQLARDPEFGQAVHEVTADSGLKTVRLQLADPSSNAANTRVTPTTELERQRHAFITDPRLEKLQQWMEGRLRDSEQEFPPAASWFVCDRWGNQIASAFWEQNRTLGNNYAFRTYFTGEARELPLQHPTLSGSLTEADLAGRRIIQTPHLSAVFRSEQSRHWKVAFSAPIRHQGEILGIVAVTVDLGSLVDFANSRNQYAVLVDDRMGEFQGAILEHPIFQQPEFDTPGVPSELAQTFVELSDGELPFPFQDPLGPTEWGERLGYHRSTIASQMPVTRSGGRAAGPLGGDLPRIDTGLKILALQDYENVLGDVRDLGIRLRQLAVLAGVVLLAVAGTIGYFVTQLMRQSRDRLARSFRPTRETTALQEMETIPSAGPLGSGPGTPGPPIEF